MTLTFIFRSIMPTFVEKLTLTFILDLDDLLYGQTTLTFILSSIVPTFVEKLTLTFIFDLHDLDLDLDLEGLSK
jgi:hypothetical protein